MIPAFLTMLTSLLLQAASPLTTPQQIFPARNAAAQALTQVTTARNAAAQVTPALPPAAQPFRETVVFPRNGQAFPNYRIPTVIQAANGDLLIFAEKRFCSIGDIGYKSIVMTRSRDNGVSWLPEETLYEPGYEASSYPTTIVDTVTSTIWLFFLRDLKEFYVMKSRDNGHSWTRPVSIHRQVAKPEWDSFQHSVLKVGGRGPGICDERNRAALNAVWEENWEQRYGIGAGNAGIRLSAGPRAGRLLVPARRFDMVNGEKTHVAYCIFSDDNGASWQTGPDVIPANGNEAQLVELPNGVIMMNARAQVSSKDTSRRHRLVAISRDGGNNWEAPYADPGLQEPTCHASIKRYRNDGKDLLLFSNPDNGYRTAKHPYGRTNMTIRLSTDQGRTWTAKKVIYPHNASYSDLVVLQDGTIGIVYERALGPDTDHYWDELAFARFPLEWITTADR